MKPALLLSLSFLFATCLAQAEQATTPLAPPDSARARVARAVEAMGGEDRLRDLRSIRLSGMGHEYWIGVGERPEGPFPTIYQQYTELRDLEGGRLRRTTASRWEQIPRWTTSTLVVSDGAAATLRGDRAAPAWPFTAEAAREQAVLAPEHALPAALDATDLRSATDTLLEGTPHHRVVFTQDGARMELSLNVHTALPTSIAVRRSYPDDFARAAFGEAETRTVLGTWKLLPGGLLYPHRFATTFAGRPWRDVAVFDVALDAEAPADSFAVPEDVRAAYAQSLAKPVSAREVGESGPPAEVRDGIVAVRDFWHSTLVRQTDGLVVFEAHLSPAYAEKLLAEAARRFPGVPLKALVLTSDPWTHLGGVRAYAERGVPIYVVDASAPFFEQILSSYPEADVRPVSGPTALGEGPNRLVLYPVRGEYSERMLTAYFPEHRLLYGTDLLWRDRTTGGYTPTQAWELARAVHREGLAPDSVFHVHNPVPAAWTDVLESIPPERRPR